MITRKLATLGLGLALALGIAGADAAQPSTQPIAGSTTAAPTQTAPATGAVQAAKPMTGEAAAAKTSKPRTKIGTRKMSSGRSVATSPKARPATHRHQHVSALKLKRHVRTHVAHAVTKRTAKHA